MDSKAVSFKLLRIYLPLLTLAGAFLVVYSLLNWFLVASSGLIPANDNVVDHWLPIGLSSALVLIFIRPAMAVLKRDAKGNLSLLYPLLAIAFVAVPTIVAQGYVRAATGKLTHVKNADEIPASADTKYYAVDHICVDHKDALIKPVVRVVGRNNQTLSIDVYAVEPVCPNADSPPGTRPVWIGLKAHTSVSNSLSRGEKEAKYRIFLDETEKRFRSEDPRSYQFLEKAGRNDDGKGFRLALQAPSSFTILPSTLILVPHLESFVQRTGQRLPWIFGSFAIGMAVWLVICLFCPLDRYKFRKWRKTEQAKGPIERAKELRRLWPRRDSYGLPILIGLNILVFLAMVLAGLGMVSFDKDDLLTWGANYRPALHGLGLLRLISSQFVHGGIMHLLGNLYGLLLAGIFFSNISRGAGLIACYLICGVCASIVSAVVHPATVAVGASGAIFGLFGVLLTLAVLRDDRVATMWKVILINVAIFAGINLALGAVNPTTDNAAHIGGLAAGVILGLLIYVTKKAKSSQPIEVGSR